LIDFIDRCIQNQTTRYELYNCGAGQAFPILHLAETIMNLNDKKLEFKFDLTKPDIPTTVILDCTKAKEELGWEPKIDVIEGLRRTSEWYKNNVQ
jgi:nucleoside-diphosphate-sugar epimerase